MKVKKNRRRKRQVNPKETATNRILVTVTPIKMDIVIQICIALGSIFAASAGAASIIKGHRDLAIWLWCAFSICGVVGLFAFIQNRAWAGDGNAQSEQNDQILKRARIVVQGPMGSPLIPLPGHPFLITVSFKNIGPTPAKNCRFISGSEAVPDGRLPNLTFSKGDYCKLQALAPSAGDIATTTIAKDIKTGRPGLLSPEMIAAAQAGQIRYFAYGRLEYDDIFGHSHWTNYCYRLAIPWDGTWEIWKDHNDTDD